MHAIVVACRLVALRKVTKCGLDLAGTGEGSEMGFYNSGGKSYGRVTRVNFWNKVTVLDSAPRS